MSNLHNLRAAVLGLAVSLAASAALAQGGISQSMLTKIKKDNAQNASDRILSNAMARYNINDLALRANNPASRDVWFSNEVPSKGISDQKQSGRCWLFSGLNVMRAKMIKNYSLGEFQFSQAYVFFYDQLEKSNLFLQAVVDNAKDPIDSQQNAWLFQHPLSDGGTFCGVRDLVSKYGLVPAEVMPETTSANNTSRMSQLISLKLREFALELRSMVAAGKKPAAIEARKAEQLSTVWHMLSICLGTPPEKFTWTRRDASGKAVDTREYTPRQFFEEYVGGDLKNDFVMLMNDPSRPYYKVYTVDMDRHVYDAPDWTYLNLPMDEIEDIAIASIKDSTMMYMSCDVGKFYDAKSGVLSLDNYDYGELLGTTFGMNKADRIRTGASASSHAMTLMAVDLATDGKAMKWKVENSWGPTAGQKGHLIMTDGWFREYLFRLVPEKKYVPEATLQLMNQTPVRLPAWDPLFQGEE